nr:hypothetical protein [Tanacetum cinerariifolium]
GASFEASFFAYRLGKIDLRRALVEARAEFLLLGSQHPIAQILQIHAAVVEREVGGVAVARGGVLAVAGAHIHGLVQRQKERVRRSSGLAGAGVEHRGHGCLVEAAVGVALVAPEVVRAERVQLALAVVERERAGRGVGNHFNAVDATGRNLVERGAIATPRRPARLAIDEDGDAAGPAQ